MMMDAHTDSQKNRLAPTPFNGDRGKKCNLEFNRLCSETNHTCLNFRLCSTEIEQFIATRLVLVVLNTKKEYKKIDIYSVSGKKRPTCFLEYLLQKSGDSNEIQYAVCRMILVRNSVNVSHFT